jgi:quercetin 2,3-dioxygenase
MMKTLHRKYHSLGKADHGWLKATHHFSFGSYYDPQHRGYGLLRVFNDDTISPLMGFAPHPHSDMEIVTIILEGKLRHKDSLGNEYDIQKGEIQVMSAGTGITHSEFSSDPQNSTRLFQIWIHPAKKGVAPRYEQASYEANDGELKLLVGPKNSGSTLWIYQDAYLYKGSFTQGQRLQVIKRVNQDSVFYMVPVEGEYKVDNKHFQTLDSFYLEGAQEFEIEVIQAGSLVIIEIPKN